VLWKGTAGNAAVSLTRPNWVSLSFIQQQYIEKREHFHCELQILASTFVCVSSDPNRAISQQLCRLFV